MKLLIQRVSSAQVEVDSKVISSIGIGCLVFLGIENDDGLDECKKLADKLSGLRIFEDENEKMNLSVVDVGGEILVVSNFTLCADCKKGNRPSFVKAKGRNEANFLYEKFCCYLKEKGIKSVRMGSFGSDMKVKLVNDGPVTVILDSKEIVKNVKD